MLRSVTIQGPRCLTVSFKCLFFMLIESESEIIDTIFDACQTDLAKPGLMLEDVQREECLTIVDHLAGESNGNIDDLFQVADTNGDGIVMRSEVSEAFKSLSLLRSGGSNPKPECTTYTVQHPGGATMKRYNCNYQTNCCNCRECKCPDDFCI